MRNRLYTSIPPTRPVLLEKSLVATIAQLIGHQRVPRINGISGGKGYSKDPLVDIFGNHNLLYVESLEFERRHTVETPACVH